jgi:hypothetical protein
MSTTTTDCLGTSHGALDGLTRFALPLVLAGETRGSFIRDSFAVFGWTGKEDMTYGCAYDHGCHLGYYFAWAFSSIR